jgi:hypothetical protein
VQCARGAGYKAVNETLKANIAERDAEIARLTGLVANKAAVLQPSEIAMPNKHAEMMRQAAMAARGMAMSAPPIQHMPAPAMQQQQQIPVANSASVPAATAPAAQGMQRFMGHEQRSNVSWGKKARFDANDAARIVYPGQ